MTPRRPDPRAAVYIISNESHTLYVGMTTDLRSRFEEHTTGAYPNGFTARYHFDRLVYYEILDDLTVAAARERNQRLAP